MDPNSGDNAPIRLPPGVTPSDIDRELARQAWGLSEEQVINGLKHAIAARHRGELDKSEFRRRCKTLLERMSP